MAGPTPQTAVKFTNMDGTSDNLSAGGTLTEEVDTGQAYGVEIIINVTGNASATDGVTIEVYMKTDTTANSGVSCNDPMFSVELDVSGGASKGTSFILDPGTYDIKAINNDSSYAATVEGWKRLLA